MTLAVFEIDGGVMEPGDLAGVDLPAEVCRGEAAAGGLILSGRGPVWLYMHLGHRAHPFGWVAAHAPAAGGAVVVMRHRGDAPRIGEVVELPDASAVPWHGGDGGDR